MSTTCRPSPGTGIHEGSRHPGEALSMPGALGLPYGIACRQGNKIGINIKRTDDFIHGKHPIFTLEITFHREGKRGLTA